VRQWAERFADKLRIEHLDIGIVLAATNCLFLVFRVESLDSLIAKIIVGPAVAVRLGLFTASDAAAGACHDFYEVEFEVTLENLVEQWTHDSGSMSGARDNCSTFRYSTDMETRKPRVRLRFSGRLPLRLADLKPLAQLNQPPPRYTRSSPVAGPSGFLVGDFA
jgi:hypothetical protein